MIHPSESEVRPATILVDVQLQKTAAEEHGASLQELRQLVETLGWDIVGTLTQKLQSPTAASLIVAGASGVYLSSGFGPWEWLYFAIATRPSISVFGRTGSLAGRGSFVRETA